MRRAQSPPSLCRAPPLPLTRSCRTGCSSPAPRRHLKLAQNLSTSFPRSQPVAAAADAICTLSFPPPDMETPPFPLDAGDAPSLFLIQFPNFWKQVSAKRIARCWAKPTVVWDKVNFYGDYWEEDNKGSWRVILRDNDGNMLVWAWGCISHCSTAKLASRSPVASLQFLEAILPIYACPLLMESDCI